MTTKTTVPSSLENILASINAITSAARIASELLEDTTQASADKARQELNIPLRNRTTRKT